MALFKTTLSGFAPVDEEALSLHKRCKPGDIVELKGSKPRSGKHLRWYWGLIHLVFQNQERYASAEMLSDAIKIAVGHCETGVLPSGTIFYQPKSIAFDKCDEGKFTEFTHAVTDLVLKHFLPTVTRIELENELREMIGT